MNLLFDLDGTLTDPAEGITRSLEYALLGMGRNSPPREELTKYIGPPLSNTFEGLVDTDDESVIAEGIQRYRERFSSIGLMENQVYPAIPSALAALQAQGHRLFVATSKPQVFALRILEHFDLSRFFDSVYGSELDGTRAEKAELIGWILRKECLFQNETKMIGDRGVDIQGARCNGVEGIGVLWGYGSREELEAAGASRLLDAPDAIAVVTEVVAITHLESV